MNRHEDLLHLAGHAPDGWLAVARETLADGEVDRLDRLRATLKPNLPAQRQRHHFIPQLHGHDAVDRPLVDAIRTLAGTQACWVTMRGGTDRVYLVQTAHDADLPVVADKAQKAIAGVEASPRVEVFTEHAVLPRYHEDALLAADILWWRSARPQVRIARTFDGCGPAGPWFELQHELFVDPAAQQALLEFLRSGELAVVARNRLPDIVSGKRDAVPADLYTDGSWVWSAAAAYYLQRYQLTPDPGLVEHATGRATGARLTHLARHAVRTALSAMSPLPPLHPSLEGVVA